MTGSYSFIVKQAFLILRRFGILGSFVFREFLVVFLDASGRIDQFLGSCVKRMAVGAKLYADIAGGRTGPERVAAGTSHRRHRVRRVNSFFHDNSLKG